MIKKLFLWTFVLIILSFSVIAPGEYFPTFVSGSEYIILHMNETSGTNATDSSGSNNHGTLNGAAAFTSGGRFGYGVNFTGASGSINWGTKKIRDYNVSGSWCMWFNATDMSNLDVFWWSGEDGIYVGTGSPADKLVISWRNKTGGSQVYIDNDDSIVANSWYHLCLVWDLTTNNNVSYYINGSLTGYKENWDSWEFELNQATGHELGGYSGTGLEFHGVLDDYVFFNTSLTHAQVSDIYNANWPVAEDISLGPAYPLNNTQYQTTELNFNVSVNSTAANFSCDLLINGTVNQSGYYGNGSDVNVNFTLNYTNTTEGEYNFFFACNTSTAFENSSNNTFFIDNVFPNIIAEPDLESSTKTFYEGNNLSSWIYFEDNNIYSYNVTINGTQAYNDTDMNGSSFNLSFTYDTDDWPGGTYEMFAETCDGHTAYALGDSFIAQPDQVAKKLTFSDNGHIIRVHPKDTALVREVSTTKYTDRYSFEFEYSDTPPDTQTFIVESTEMLKIRTYSDYEGHLITGKKWIDFENNDNAKTTIKRINDYKVEVTLTGVTSKTLVFNSIGDLNCVNETYYFSITGTSTDFTDQVLIGQPDLFQLNVTVNTSMVGDVNATLHYNNTAYFLEGVLIGNIYQFNQTLFAPPISALNESKEVVWEINTDGNITNTTGSNQTIFRIVIDNCSLYETIFVNYSIKDETTGVLSNATLDYQFNFYGYNYTGSFIGETGDENFSYAFCMYPAWANFSTNVSIDYRASTESLTSRSYTQLGHYVSNVTNQTTLEILSNPTEITVHIIDAEDNDLPGILVEAYRYDTDTDTDILVQSETTDDNGNVIFGLRRAITRYSFRIYQDGDLKIRTSRFKLFATTYEYVIQENITNRLAEYYLVDNDVIRSLTYTNVTDLVNFTWSYENRLISEVCFNITDFNTTYYSNCSSLNGSFLYTITTKNISYFARGFVKTVTGNTYTLETLSIDTNTDWRIWGRELGITLAIILYLFCTLMGLSFARGKGVTGTVVLLTSVAALTIIYFFKITPMGLPTLIGLIFLHLIALIVLNKRDEI